MAVGVYNLGVYVHSLSGELLASSEISVETLASCNDPFASNHNELWGLHVLHAEQRLGQLAFRGVSPSVPVCRMTT